jgi:glycolate oxidase FAD binding subunit
MNGIHKKLEAIVGPEHLLAGDKAAGYAVDGVPHEAAVLPGSVEEVSAALAVCHEMRAAVVPWGGGTMMGLGNPPTRLSVVMALSRLNAILDFEPADMTCTIQAGVSLGACQEVLGRSGQFLALDPPRAERATIGGILASNASGPIRFRYGTARDLVIGARIVQADGVVIKSGAKVVKNVTGYDMNKLYVGSLGTLGVIVEASLRLHPVPPCRATLLAAFGDARGAQAAVSRILDSPLAPTAVELIALSAWDGVRSRAGLPTFQGKFVLALEIASVQEAVAAQLAAAQEISAEAAAAELCEIETGKARAFWRAVRDFRPEGEGGAVLKASLLPGSVAEACLAAMRLADESGLRLGVIAEAGTGVVRFFLAGDGPAEERDGRIAAAATILRDLAARSCGHLVVETAPLGVKRKVDVWGPAGTSLSLMQRIKAAFDPHGILNPGRFVGGL